MSFRIIFHFVGLLLIGLGGLMALMVMIAFGFGETAQAVRFGGSAIVTGFVAGAFMLGLRGDETTITSRRDLFAMLFFGWLLVPLFAGLPLLNAALGLSVFEAWFESLSALTTTGISLIDPLRHDVPQSLFLWRAMMGWIGGFCAVIMMIVFLAPAALGGLEVAQLSFTHGEGEGVLSRSTQVIRSLFPLYVIVTFFGWILITVSGANALDGLILSMGAVSTSGIVGPQGTALFAEQNLVTLPVGILCLFGAMNMTHHMRLVSSRRFGFRNTYFSDPEIGVILAWIGAAALITMIGLYRFDDVPLISAAIAGLFDAVSFVSTTGFSLSPHLAGSGAVPFPVSLVLGMAMVIGGAVGSTASGLRPMRLIILMMQGARELSRMVHERAVVRFRYRHQPLPSRVVRAVAALIVVYALCGLGCAFGFAVSGMSAEHAMIAALSAMTNCGPALSFMTDGMVTGEDLSDMGQAVYAIGMLLGRVEVLAFIALLTPQYWRR